MYMGGDYCGVEEGQGQGGGEEVEVEGSELNR